MTGPVEMAPDGGAVETISRDDRRAAIAAAQGEVETCVAGDLECGSRHERWFCVRRAGHVGLHVALTGGGPRDVCAVWPEPRPVLSSPAQVDGETDEGVTQTLLAGRTDGVPGNCVQAAIASLLSLPIEAVPHFLLWKLWNYRLREWLEEQGYTISVRSMNSIPAERCIVAGMSPRGVAHVCVAEGGRVVWDPHPSRAGLGRVDEAWFIGEAS